MKKKLALLLVVAIVATMFVSVLSSASAATAGPAPAGDVLKYQVTSDSSEGGVKYWYTIFSREQYDFKTGDMIEYDVYIDKPVDKGLGAVEVYNTYGSWFRDQNDFVDQNGTGGHPDRDISVQAGGKWFHRVLSVPVVMYDTTSDNWNLAVENPAVSKSFTVYYDNIVVTNGGKVVKELYRGGQPAENMDRDGCIGYTAKMSVVTNPYPVALTGEAGEAGKIKETLRIDNKSMLVTTEKESKSIALDAAPTIKDGRTCLPIRAVVENLGAKLDWDPATMKITITLGDKTIEMWVNQSKAKINGVDTQIDPANAKVMPYISNSRTLVPLRFVSENLGAQIGWDDSTKTITITYTIK